MSRAIRRVVVALFVVTTATLASAQTRPSSAFDGLPVERGHAAAAAATHGGVDWQRLVLAMALVVGLIVLLRYAAGWLFPSVRGRANGRAVRVLGRTAIAPRQQVLLLQVGRRVLVVGDSGGNLSALANIDDADEVAELVGQAHAPATPDGAARFRQLFGRAKTDYELPSPQTQSDQDDAEDTDETPSDDPRVAAAQDEIAGILDKMRSITKTIRR